jgi:hydrogenase/urease accessory protein HupE
LTYHPTGFGRAATPLAAGRGTESAPYRHQTFPNGQPRALRLVAIIVFNWFALTARAHAPETSYCKIRITPEAVETTFTFDLATLRLMAPFDANRDGRVTQEEVIAAAPGFEKFIREHVFLEINEREVAFGTFVPPVWPNDPAKPIARADWSQRLIAFSFRNPLLHAPDAVAITFDLFDAVSDQHKVLGSFLWNGTDNPVIFTRFEPDYYFDTGYRIPAWEQFRTYLWLGVEHIFLGYDHIAFLLALFFVRRFVALLKIITAFTVAHTLTLALAALGVVSLPSRFVESAIAVSIIYVAAENLWRRNDVERGEHRWRITFAFGLVHGFGFAAVLRELGLPSEGLIRSLLAFNLGVEIGQLAIAAACWPLLVWIGRQTWAPRVRIGVSCVLLAFGVAWLIERAFALNFLPI